MDTIRFGDSRRRYARVFIRPDFRERRSRTTGEKSPIGFLRKSQARKHDANSKRDEKKKPAFVENLRRFRVVPGRDETTRDVDAVGAHAFCRPDGFADDERQSFHSATRSASENAVSSTRRCPVATGSRFHHATKTARECNNIRTDAFRTKTGTVRFSRSISCGLTCAWQATGGRERSIIVLLGFLRRDDNTLTLYDA